MLFKENTLVPSSCVNSTSFGPMNFPTSNIFAAALVNNLLCISFNLMIYCVCERT
ncbi:hypothetical protein Syun_025543 [Stephania yunnanensis]|uniref:Uncharacterized protein n=1 Tax=Stephania yunnanensis TaxID=152371 RepID=A0AAP0EZ10_9MAGN